MYGEIFVFVVIDSILSLTFFYCIIGRLIILPLMKRKRCDDPTFLKRAQDKFTEEHPISQYLDFKDFLIVAYEEKFLLFCLFMGGIITSFIHHFSFNGIPFWGLLLLSFLCGFFYAIFLSDGMKDTHIKIVYKAQQNPDKNKDRRQ